MVFCSRRMRWPPGAGRMPARCPARRGFCAGGSGTRRQFDRTIVPGLGQFNLRLELEHTGRSSGRSNPTSGIGCLSRLALREAFQRGSLV